jgi:predicted Na+-dependent transporter
VAWIKKHINTANISSFCILLLVWVTFCNTFSNGSTKQVPGRDVAATVFLGVALFFLFLTVSFVVAWPPPPLTGLRRLVGFSRADVVAIVICGSTKTVALGVPLINVMYKQVPYAGLLAMPLIIYHALQVLLGGLMLETLKKWCLNADKDGSPTAQHSLGNQHSVVGSSRRWSLAQLLLPGGRTSSNLTESQPAAAAAVAAAGVGSDNQQLPR